MARFIEIEAEGNEELENKFLVWENTVIVKAKSLSEAYEKIETIGKEHAEPYEGGEDGVPVMWIYEGITELVPIYEELEDGSEIIFKEYKSIKLKKLRKRIVSKDEIYQ